MHFYPLDGAASLSNKNGSIEDLLCGAFQKHADAARRLAKKIEADARTAAKKNADSHRAGNDSSQYFLQRYIELFCPIHKFIATTTARAWLFLNTPKLSTKKAGFRSDIVEDYIHLCCMKMPEKGEDVLWFFLNSKRDYQKQIDDIQAALNQGKRVMVFAAYKSISTGQNLQYRISPEEAEISVCIAPDAAPDDPRLTERDFDGIVLGEMTHMIWSPDPNAKPAEDILRGISEYEVMMERGIISQNAGRRTIRSILKGTFNWTPRAEKRNILIRRRKMRQLIQATGRISRAFQKLPNIYLFASTSVLRDVDPAEMQQHALTYEQRFLAKEAANIYQVPTANEQEQYIINEAELRSNVSNQNINRILNQARRVGWTAYTIGLWQEMRELALKYPTFDELPEHLKKFAKIFYFEKPLGHAPQYFFFSRNDSGSIVVSFDATKDDFYRHRQSELIGYDDKLTGPPIQEMSEASARLDILLKFPGFQEYMEEHGYATHFGDGKFLMTPTFFNNIYKGALGEAFCDFLFRELGYPLSPIEEEAIFEQFDFRLRNDLFVDAKNWSENFEQSNQEEQEKIHKKLEKTHGRTIIVNIVGDEKYRVSLTDDQKVLTIPGLIDHDGHLLKKNIEEIKKFIEGEGNA